MRYLPAVIKLLASIIIMSISGPAFSGAIVYMGTYKGEVNAGAACFAIVGQIGPQSNGCRGWINFNWNWLALTGSVPTGVTAYVALKENSTGQYIGVGNSLQPSSDRTGYYWVYVDSCPVGDTEDPTTHECVSPNNACSALTSPAYYIEASPPLIGYSPPHLVCSDNCQYAYVSSAFSTDDASIMDVYNPTQEQCSLEEESRELIASDDMAPPQADPCSALPNVIICYPEDEPPTCFMNESSALGAPIMCPADVSNAANERCGFINGAYICVDTSKRSCGTVNGKFVCFAKTNSGQFSTNPIPLSSPDHPLNGGNANGDESDDVFENAAEVAANSLSLEDVQRELQKAGLATTYRATIGGTTNYHQAEGAFDDAGIIGAIDALANRLEALYASLFGSDEDLVVPAYEDAIAGANDVIEQAIGTVGVADSLSFEANTSHLSSALTAIIPTPGSCDQIPLQLHQSLTLQVDLCQLNTVRLVLSWLFYVATAASLFMLVVQRERE